MAVQRQRQKQRQEDVTRNYGPKGRAPRLRQGRQYHCKPGTRALKSEQYSDLGFV
jgi:hypothetical protein